MLTENGQIQLSEPVEKWSQHFRSETGEFWVQGSQNYILRPCIKGISDPSSQIRNFRVSKMCHKPSLTFWADTVCTNSHQYLLGLGSQFWSKRLPVFLISFSENGPWEKAQNMRSILPQVTTHQRASSVESHRQWRIQKTSALESFTCHWPPKCRHNGQSGHDDRDEICARTTIV